MARIHVFASKLGFPLLRSGVGLRNSFYSEPTVDIRRTPAALTPHTMGYVYCLAFHQPTAGAHDLVVENSDATVGRVVLSDENAISGSDNSRS